MKKKILVVDIGGTHVKLMISPTETRKFDSGTGMGPLEFVRALKAAVAGWNYDAISIGFPAPVHAGKIVGEPKHLAKGWPGAAFAKSLGKPARVINDAAMQALGSFHGRRMLFLGLGTGLGSALVWKETLLPLELSDLPYSEREVIEARLGKRGLESLGEKAWKREVLFAVAQLKRAFIADYVVLGGGHANLFDSLPEGIERGDNRKAYLGGERLWETSAQTRRPTWQIL
jgi:polyphosphate glucokinase